MSSPLQLSRFWSEKHQKNTGFILLHNQLRLWPFTVNQIIAALKQVNKQASPIPEHQQKEL